MLADGVWEWFGTLVPLRGMAKWEGAAVFKTHLAQTYPPLLSVHLARAVYATLNVKQSDSSLWPPDNDSAQLPLALQFGRGGALDQ